VVILISAKELFQLKGRRSLAMKENGVNGWKRLLEGYPWFDREGAYPIPAYSEFMPSPWSDASLWANLILEFLMTRILTAG
jgi:hypothetical protein